MDVRKALTRLGGVSERRALLDIVSRRALAGACERGEVIRVARNVYVLPAAEQARVAAARAHGVVSHLSAAMTHGWKVKSPPTRPTVTVPRNRTARGCADIDVRYAHLAPDDILDAVTSPARTVIDCARTLPFDEALAVADSALRTESLTHNGLVHAAASCPRTGRPAALRVATTASELAANPFESVLRAIALEVPGLSVQPQGAVESIGHADLTDPALRIAVEAESFEFHALPEAFRYDIRRYTAMTRLGWLVARFVWEDVMHNPAYVRNALLDLVALRGA